MRVATFAAERGAGAAFAIAAGRLAFCGGFDIEDRAIIADAAAAAGLDVDEALAAAVDARRDPPTLAAGELHDELPALRDDEHLYCGEEHITAALLLRARAMTGPPSAA
jgi:2-hydroxychromene-2-carboxylate isomerase